MRGHTPPTAMPAPGQYGTHVPLYTSESCGQADRHSVGATTLAGKYRLGAHDADGHRIKQILVLRERAKVS